MKKSIFFAIFFLVLFAERGYSQNKFFPCATEVDDRTAPPVAVVKNGVTYWYGKQAKEVVDTAELIFEGRVLTDSSFFYGVYRCISHRVLIIKKFKGYFKSDTMMVVNVANRVGRFGEQPVDVSIGDEDVFFLKKKNPGNLPFYLVGYRFNVSLITVCDKNDIIKEVYEPIEAVTGQPYKEVHPNLCVRIQQQK